MKIRTVEDLDDRIRADLTWRRHEIQFFNQQLVSAGPIGARSLLRASVALLYAHWEGFIKTTCHYYLCYVASLKLDTGQLSPELAAYSLRSTLKRTLDSQSSALHIEMVNGFRNSVSATSKIPTKIDAIQTKSNLSFPVLRNLLISIGLDPSLYESSSDLIDTQLVDSRNKIAHGENDYISQTEWRDLETQVVDIMESISTAIVNHAVLKNYLVGTDS